MSSLGKAVKFPAVTFSIALVIGFAAIQGYIQYTGAGHTPEVQHIEPTISTDSYTYQLGSWMQITVKVGEAHHEMEYMEEMEEVEAGDHHHDEEEGGFVVRVVVYSPDGSILAIKKGTTNHDGEAAFSIFIESGSQAGIYTIVSEATSEGQPTVIGETVTIEVVD
ncbi:MAG: hypothetical protein ACE5KU_05860 [Nitrososphaerales archaeon]